MITFLNCKLIRPTLSLLCAIGLTQNTDAVIYKAELWTKDNTTVCLLSDIHEIHIMCKPERYLPYIGSQQDDLTQMLEKCCDIVEEKQITLITEDDSFYSGTNEFLKEQLASSKSKDTVLHRLIPLCNKYFPTISATSSDSSGRHTLLAGIHLSHLSSLLKDNHRETLKEILSKPTIETFGAEDVATIEQGIIELEGIPLSIGDLINEMESVCQKSNTSGTDEIIEGYRNHIKHAFLNPLKKMFITPEKTHLCQLFCKQSPEETLSQIGLSTSASFPNIEINNLATINLAHKEKKSLVVTVMGGFHAINIARDLAAKGYKQIATPLQDSLISQFMTLKAKESDKMRQKYTIEMLIDASASLPNSTQLKKEMDHWQKEVQIEENIQEEVLQMNLWDLEDPLIALAESNFLEKVTEQLCNQLKGVQVPHENTDPAT